MVYLHSVMLMLALIWLFCMGYLVGHNKFDITTKAAFHQVQCHAKRCFRLKNSRILSMGDWHIYPIFGGLFIDLLNPINAVCRPTDMLSRLLEAPHASEHLADLGTTTASR